MQKILKDMVMYLTLDQLITILHDILFNDNKIIAYYFLYNHEI